MAPKTTMVGDRIAIIFGSRGPVVLRPKGDAYQLVGSCFVDGLMKGEAMAEIEKGVHQADEIALC